MNFITMLCLALANCEQFMSLSKAEDHGVSARSDLAEIDDLNLTAPSPLQRLLSADVDDEEEEDEAEEDEENEEESEVEDGKNAWLTPQVGVAAGIAGLYGCQRVFGAKPPATPAATPEPTKELIITFPTEAAVTKFTEAFDGKVTENTGGAELSRKVETTLPQLTSALATELLQGAEFTIAGTENKEDTETELTPEQIAQKEADDKKKNAKDPTKTEKPEEDPEKPEEVNPVLVSPP